jgi:protein-S-isoprenylcysteine O-methyltransferase Ste14
MNANRSMIRRAIVGGAALVAVLALVLFVSARSVNYWQAWLYLFIFTLATSAISLYLIARDPALMERRLRAGPAAETELAQQIIQSVASVSFLLIYVVAGLDRRFGWSSVSDAFVLAGDVLVVLGFWIVFLTFRENSHASATIEVGKDQPVISTGPYAVVRHPMYAGAGILIFASAPALGSPWSLVPAIALMAGIVWRLIDEERFLSTNLPGYAEYCRQTRYRLIPSIW